jgi:mono/diheme cytochrome c family protein
VWLAEHVKNPKTHNPGSRMPAFEGKISDADLRALSAYLASLK